MGLLGDKRTDRQTTMKPASDDYPLLVLILGWLFLAGCLALLLVQPNAGIDVRYHWGTAVILVGAGCYWATRIRSGTPSIAAFTLWLCVFGLASLTGTWQAGHSDGSIIAGLLPYSDANGYFQDAQRILSGEPISAFSSRRPMFAGWLGGLLTLTGNNLRLAMGIMTLTVSLSLAYAASALRGGRSGSAAAIAMAALTWLFYRRFVGTTLTEHLGLALGLLAFGLLWRGARTSSRQFVWLGLFFLTLALNARAGTFFVLPLLVLWAGFALAGRGQRFSWQATALMAAAVVCGFAANRMLLVGLGGSGASAFSNFSFTLYGLVKGGDWTMVLQEHPGLGRLPADAQAAEVYRLALGHIAYQPWSLLQGAIRAWGIFAVSAYSFAAAFQPYSTAFLGSYVLTALAMTGFHAVWRWRRDPEVGMASTALSGIVLSVPFVPPWDADSMRAYAATLPFLLLLPALGVAVMASDGEDRTPKEAPQGLAGQGLALLAGVVCLCFLLPLAAHGRLGPTELPKALPACAAHLVVARLRVVPGTLVQISDGPPGIDRRLVRLLVREPMAAANQMVEAAFGDRIPLSRLKLNSVTGHAPEPPVEFIAALNVGDALAMATARYPNGAAFVGLAHFSKATAIVPDAEFDACVDPRPGRVYELKVS